MAPHISTFKSAKSLVTIEKITALLKERNGASARDIASALNMARQNVCSYLKHMKTLGLVVCTEEAVSHPRGSTGAHWEALDVAIMPPEAEEPERDQFPRKVIVRKEWAPHHARSWLDCYLFGVPATLERIAP